MVNGFKYVGRLILININTQAGISEASLQVQLKTAYYFDSLLGVEVECFGVLLVDVNVRLE